MATSTTESQINFAHEICTRGDLDTFLENIYNDPFFYQSACESSALEDLIHIITGEINGVDFDIQAAPEHFTIFSYIASQICFKSRTENKPVPDRIKEAMAIATERDSAHLVAILLNALHVTQERFSEWYSLQDLQVQALKGNVQIAKLICVCHPDRTLGDFLKVIDHLKNAGFKTQYKHFELWYYKTNAAFLQYTPYIDSLCVKE
jgi:hypothetical protein